MPDAITATNPTRVLKPALLNGLRLKCPRCGDGALLHSYLKPLDHCTACAEDLSHQRADDGPAYLTILIVGHLMTCMLHFVYVTFRPEPLTLALTLGIFVVVASVLMLPRVKGMIIAYRSAKGMQGF